MEELRAMQRLTRSEATLINPGVYFRALLFQLLNPSLKLRDLRL
jgi:hypothetical protein